MKKVIAGIAALLLTATMAGCGNDSGRIQDERNDSSHIEEVEPVFDPRKYGFESEQNMGRWIEVNGISAENGYAVYREFGYEQYVRGFKENAMSLYDSYDLIPRESPSEVRAYEVLNNDSIQVTNGSGTYTITITERVVNGNFFAFKTIIRNTEKWFVLEDMLDWDRVERIDNLSDPDDEYRKTRKYYFKTQN